MALEQSPIIAFLTERRYRRSFQGWATISLLVSSSSVFFSFSSPSSISPHPFFISRPTTYTRISHTTQWYCYFSLLITQLPKKEKIFLLPKRPSSNFIRAGLGEIFHFPCYCIRWYCCFSITWQDIWGCGQSSTISLPRILSTHVFHYISPWRCWRRRWWWICTAVYGTMPAKYAFVPENVKAKGTLKWTFSTAKLSNE